MKILCSFLVACCCCFAVSVYAEQDAAPTNAAASSATPSSPHSDHALAIAVRRALGKSQGFNVSGVLVKARNGVVTLSGSVRSGDQIARAGDIAKSVQGVREVNNKLVLFHGGNG